MSVPIHFLKLNILHSRHLDPLPIAVSPLYIEPGSKDIKVEDKIIKNVGEKISEVIEVNFKRSGLFNPLKKDSFVQNPDIAHIKPRFEDWRLIKAQALVTGKVTVSDEKLRVEFRLWDVVAAKEMVAVAFSTTPDNWRRVAHIISDKIYKRLTCSIKSLRVLLNYEIYSSGNRRNFGKCPDLRKKYGDFFFRGGS